MEKRGDVIVLHVYAGEDRIAEIALSPEEQAAIAAGWWHPFNKSGGSLALSILLVALLCVGLKRVIPEWGYRESPGRVGANLSSSCVTRGSIRTCTPNNDGVIPAREPGSRNCVLSIFIRLRNVVFGMRAFHRLSFSHTNGVIYGPVLKSMKKA